MKALVVGHIDVSVAVRTLRLLISVSQVALSVIYKNVDSGYSDNALSGI